MFSKKHYINWFSLLFIILSIIIYSSNILLLNIGSNVLINNLFNSFLIIIIFFIVDKYLDPDKIDLFSVTFAFILSFISYSSFFPLGFYLIFLLFFFRNNLKNFFFSIFLIIAFYSLIEYLMIGEFKVDIIYWDFSMGWIVLLYILSTYSGWMVADMQEVYFSTGVFIFLWSLILWICNEKYLFRFFESGTIFNFNPVFYLFI